MSRAVALLVLFLGGCHYYFEDDDDDGFGGDVDAGWGAFSDAALAGETDAQVEGCDAVALLPTGFVPVESVSTGDVVNEEESPGVFLTEVNATAGGADGQTTNPFIYLDLLAEDGAAKVEIDDVAAFDSDTWDLALKRYVVRTNGGDSGPADGVVDTVASPELTFAEEVGDAFADDWSSASCELVIDDVGGPLTRFSDWYQVMNGRFLPRAVTHVVRLRDGSHAEIDIDTYYADGNNPNRGGVYRLRWYRF